MRIDDASSLPLPDGAASGTLVAVKPGQLSIVYIEPEDHLDAVLAALAQHGRPVIIVLPEQGSVFSQAADFARLKQSHTPAIISVVIPRERMSLVGQLAYNEGFPFTSSLPKVEAAFFQAQQPDGAQAAPFSVEDHAEKLSVNGNDHLAGPGAPGAIARSASLRKLRSRKAHQVVPIAFAVVLLIVVSVALLPTLFAQSGTPLTVKTGTPASPATGLLAFTGSGQLDPNSSTGLNDIVSLNLTRLTQPSPGKSLYAWLLTDKTQDAMAPILLGKLQIVGGKAQLTYRHPQFLDLLVSYSRLLITEQPSGATPSSPPLDAKAWRYQGSIPDIPTPGDEKGFSFLSHLRHLLAKDPTLTDLGLSGGLSTWLYRNTGKVFEWANAARDDWAGNNPDLLRRQVERVVQYMDGEAYAFRELPPGTPWLVDPKAGRPGLIDFSSAPQQGPVSYLSHVRTHLTGMVNAPGHTDMQRQFAIKIDTALTRIEAIFKQVRADAVQLARMSDTQLAQPAALTLLNDLQTNASKAYVGQTDPTTGEVQEGVVWIHDQLQLLATISVAPATSAGP